jgi:hypothetical protein
MSLARFFLKFRPDSGREAGKESAFFNHRNTQRRYAMSMLEGFNFVAAPRAASHLSAEEMRRSKLVKQLQEQRAIALAEAAGNTHVVKRYRWLTNEAGERVRVAMEKRLKPWWAVQADGQLLLTVRWGPGAIAWEPGKAAIAISDAGRLISVLDQLIAATQAGELDLHIAAANRARSMPKRRAA